MSMSRRAISRAALGGLVLVVTASWSKPSSPGETQAGAASDANRAPYAGGERATCRDLPSADDLKKWLREAPGVEGEAGGQFSGKMECDTACADHEIAKRVRHLAQLDPEKGEFADDIVFTAVDGASPFAHPLCANTWRNGQKLGDEAKSAGY